MTSHETKSGVVRTLIDNSALLIAGAVIALVWANVHTDSYNKFVHYDVAAIFGGDHPAESHDAESHAAEAHETESHAVEGSDADAHADDSSASAADHADEHSDQHGGHGGLTIHYIINDILMALFFAIAAKEVWESLLPGGALLNPAQGGHTTAGDRWRNPGSSSGLYRWNLCDGNQC